MKLNFKHLKVHEVKEGSVILTGHNQPTSFQNTKRVNDGFGSLIGNKNEMKNSQNVYKHVHTSPSNPEQTND